MAPRGVPAWYDGDMSKERKAAFIIGLVLLGVVYYELKGMLGDGLLFMAAMAATVYFIAMAAMRLSK